jgi:glyoxylase-like metal-dependent hydrolase (beta-lactamase superfamily II)
VIVAEDSHKLDFSGRGLVFIDAPGHARHHYVIWDAASRGIFAGDVFGISYRELDTPRGRYVLPTTTPVQFEPEAWRATLDRLMALNPACAYLTHYGRIDGMPRATRSLRSGLAAYERLARQHAGDKDRHAAIRQALGEHSLTELKAMFSPLSEAKARELLQFDMELNTQGLEVWLDRAAA